MRLKQLGMNSTIVTFDNKEVLYSYNTPVGWRDRKSGAVYITKKKWSPTTSKHINKWLGGAIAVSVEQEMLDRLAGIEEREPEKTN